MKLSIIIPSFNEVKTIKEILKRVKLVDVGMSKEIIIVDDFSTDGTRRVLENLKDNEIKLVYHHKNMGKGASIRTGLAEATGEIILIQDADLEYDPSEYPQLLRPIMDGCADVVYGARPLGPHMVMPFTHLLGNQVLTNLINILHNTSLTDMETGYKVFKSHVLKNLKIRSNGFNFEAEVTIKVLKRGFRIFEVPISYYGRTYAEGKKIGWKDGLFAIWAIIKYRFVD